MDQVVAQALTLYGDLSGGKQPWPDRSSTRPLEIWAGIECTVNRVGDRTFDQLASSGHDRRDEDLALIASLGITAVRYPVLWERTTRRVSGRGRRTGAGPTPGSVELRERGNPRDRRALMHHGSGPAHTSLIDPAFPFQLARYAGAVAARYPWLTCPTRRSTSP